MSEKYTDEQPSSDHKTTINKLSLAQFAEKAYLDYSMYVILDRALPHIGDGLKPVQRRIIYAMSDLGLHATAKYKKSARTVGDVLGKFHPHGDTACYEAMVLMAQPFSYRYPLVDGQGNWGSQDDPKSFAAMRYTESRLTLYAQLLLEELGQGTSEWVANFDGTLEEPKLLPARIPNVLLNGASGIAVGMATDILPHNMQEVVSACVRILEEPETTLEQICQHIQAPDFPTQAEIISSKQEIFEVYQTGNGSIRQRATWRKEDNDIVIDALPYQVSGARIQEQIASQMLAKKLPMVTDLRDESDHENPTRLVIELKSSHVDIEPLMQHFFATTDLERAYRVNLNLIGLNGKPKVFNLRELLVEWLEFRIETTKKRLQFRYEKILERLQILDGLLIAFLNIDEVIRIIRNEDHPKEQLIKKFQLSDVQADAILNMRLRHLAKLEEIRITTEQSQLSEERKILESTLKSKKKLKTLIRDELIADAEIYGDSRRSPIIQRSIAKPLERSKLIATEPVTVILSNKGWIRAAKGHDIDGDNLNYKPQDQFLCQTRGTTNDLLLTIDSIGRTYTLSAHSLPSARSLGEPISSNLKPQSSVTFQGLMMGNNDTEYLLSTSAGYGFIAKLEDMHTRNKAGKALLKPTPESAILVPRKIKNSGDGWVAILTNNGRLLIFSTQEINRLSKGKGIKLINIPTTKFKTKEEFVIDTIVFQSQQILRIHSGKRYLNLKESDLQSYLGKRAQRGHFLPRGFTQAQGMTVIEK